MRFYEPVEVSEKAYLIEVLQWVALGRVPRFASDPDGKDARGDLDNHEEYYSPPPCDFFSEQEFEAIGAKFNYSDYFDVILDEEVGFRDRRELIEHFEFVSRISGIHQEPSKEALQKADFFEQCNSLFDPRLEAAKAQIVGSLLSGELSASGLSTPESWFSEDVEDHKDDPIRESIPKDLWNFAGIDWMESSLSYGEACYQLVTFSFDAVAKFFPSPLIGDTVIEGVRFGETICLGDGKAATPSKVTRGRPPKIGGSVRTGVQKYFGRKLQRGELPDKREALYQEVIEFVELAFGERISRTSAQTYLKEILSSAAEIPAGK